MAHRKTRAKNRLKCEVYKRNGVREKNKARKEAKRLKGLNTLK